MASPPPAHAAPYRAALVALFFVLAGVPALLFFRSVIGSLFLAPQGGPAELTPGGRSTCLEEAEHLRQELSDHLDGLRALASRQGSAGLRQWQTFALRFEARLGAARDRCRGSEGSADLLDALELLSRIASRTATRLLTESGDDLRRIEATFARARGEARTTGE